ncbi:unnamed protein product [Rotaria sp. Silwood1]|nr:unnamed protein product [Rotaria sp. Silwood1]
MSSAWYINEPIPPKDERLVYAHGTVMVLAWILLASTGILFARYGRLLRIGTRRKLLGSMIWFQIHRLILCLVTITTLLGFFLILVNENGKWVSADKDGRRIFAHSVLGAIIVCCTLLQAWIALFRCRPDSPYRSIFNWLHRSMGYLPFFLSIPTIFLIVVEPKALPMERGGFIAILSIWSAWIVLVVILFEAVEYRARVELEDGGGTRFCNWEPINMDFEDVHHRLLNIFSLGESKSKTLLYDFQRQPFDTTQYKTFLEYFNKNGLNCNSTVIYICIDQGTDDDNSTTLTRIKTPSKSDSLNPQQNRISIQSEATSTITPVKNKYVDKYEESDQEQTFRSSSVYTFENSINDLVNNIHSLISQIGFDETLIQLFESICIVRGYIRSVINPLQQQIKHLNENFKLINKSEMILYSNCLNNVSDICQSIETLIKSNKKKFDHIEQFSMIVYSFFKLYENLKILYNQWFECVEKSNNRSNIPSSSFIHPVESIPSPSSHSNIQVSTKDHYEINEENSNKRSQTSLPPSRQTSSSLAREPSDDETDEKFRLFRQLFSRLSNLFHLLTSQALLSYSEMVDLTVHELKSLRSNLELCNYNSILDAKKQILSIREKYYKEFSEYFSEDSKYKTSAQVTRAYDFIMKAIQRLLGSLNDYQSQLEKNNEKKESHRPSTFSSKDSQKQYQHNNSMQYFKRKSANFHIHNNNKRLTASYSSIEYRTYVKNDRRRNERKQYSFQ